MLLSGAMVVALTLSAGGDERLLLCRPEVVGEPAQARADAVAKAAGKLRGRFLDYGAECKDAGEGVRAARRAGLPHVVVSKAEATAEGSRYELVLADADADAANDGIRAKRQLEVKLTLDAVSPMKGALKDLLKTLPPKPGPDPQHVAAWTVAGVGAAALVAGVVLSATAGDVKGIPDGVDESQYIRERARVQQDRKKVRQKRQQGNVLMGLGAAVVAGGLTWRFVF